MGASHEELDQALIARVHLFLANCEADSGSVHDREIVGHGSIESNEPVIEDPKLVTPFARPDLGLLLWLSLGRHAGLRGGRVGLRLWPRIGPDGGLGRQIFGLVRGHEGQTIGGLRRFPGSGRCKTMADDGDREGPPRDGAVV